MKDRCPPHKFFAAWESPPPMICCQWCGEVREMKPMTGEAPDSEKLTPEEQAQIGRDYGEPT